MKRNKYIDDFWLLGIYQIIGGALGIVLYFIYHSSSGKSTLHDFIFLVVFLVMFGFSIFCGVSLLLSWEHSLRASLFNQYLQLISLTSSAFSFTYVAGFSMFIDPTFREPVNFLFPSLTFAFNMAVDEGILSCNIIALLIILYIHSSIRSIGREEEYDEIDKIGRLDVPESEIKP